MFDYSNQRAVGLNIVLVVQVGSPVIAFVSIISTHNKCITAVGYICCTRSYTILFIFQRTDTIRRLKGKCIFINASYFTYAIALNHPVRDKE